MTQPDITLLMPTYNRCQFVQRQLAYLDKYLTDTNIVVYVLDGSDDEFAEKNQALCAQASSKITYHRYPTDLHFFQREYAGIELTTTPLVAMLPDDDFFNAKGLQEAISFMKNNPDFACAHGKYIGFRLLENNPEPQVWKGYKNQETLSESDPVERLFQYFGNYTPVHYAVHRTSTLKQIFSDMLTSVDGQDFKSFEFLVAGLTVISGKAKMLDSFYMARQADVSSEDSKRTILEDLFEPLFSERYQRFQQCMASYLPSEIPEDKRQQLVNVSFGQYIGSYLKPKALNNRFTEIKRQLKSDASKANKSYEQASAINSVNTRDAAFMFKRLKQTLRHPKKLMLFPPPEVNYPEHSDVLDFLKQYQSQETAIKV